MNFNPNATIDNAVLAKARLFMGTLPDIPEGDIHRIYLHWAVAPFGCTFTDYNFMVNLINGQWVIQTTGDPRDNVPGLTNKPVHSHTWHRNSYALGIAIGGMDGATTSNFGPDAVQLHELEVLCAAAATVAKAYGVQANLPVGITMREHTIMTHAECAAQDGYFGERWDLARFEPGPISPEIARAHGDLLRKRIHVIKAAM